MKRLLVIMTLLLWIAFGCDAINNSTSGSKNNLSEQLPETLAFQDEFTREFMASTEEVEDGYYLFESRTGGFTMLFPVNARMDRSYYQYGETKEEIEIYEHNEKENEGYNIIINYFDEESTNWIDSYLNLLSSTNDYDGEFEEYKVNDNQIYFGERILEIDDKSNGTFYIFFSYIKSDTSDKALTFNYGIRCIDQSKKCHLNFALERNNAKRLMESVEFNTDS